MTPVLGEFEQLVLMAVVRLGDEAYGATIRREIEARTARRLSISAVYTTLVTHSLWRRRFGADAAIVGRTIEPVVARIQLRRTELREVIVEATFGRESPRIERRLHRHREPSVSRSKPGQVSQVSFVGHFRAHRVR